MILNINFFDMNVINFKYRQLFDKSAYIRTLYIYIYNIK